MTTQQTLHRLIGFGEPEARLVRCPDCGQMEWWSEEEMTDHGRCRTGAYPCGCDE